MSEQRLIDAEALLKRLKEIHCMDGIKMRLEVEDAPTVEAGPVKHGKWISIIKEHPFFSSKKVVDGYTCSECGRYEAEKEPYCNCGARMDKE